MRALRLLAAAAAALACGGSGPRAETTPARLEILEAGRFDFRGGDDSDPELVAEEISGLVRTGDDRYLAVSDEHAALHELRIAVDPASGRVASVRFERPVRLTDGSGGPDRRDRDREAVAYDPASRSVWIAEEAGPSLRRHALDGRTLEVVDPGSDPALAAFGSARPNLGFEALARRPDDGGYWAANEEALRADGPTSTPEAGSVVRLVSFDASMRPIAQYAYVTDPVPGPISSPIPAVGHELSGVSGLVALPSGTLLVLERALGGDAGGMAGFRLRIYEVDFAGASDVGAGPLRAGLEGRRFEPVAKRLLYETRRGLPVSNFEAFARGPELSDGSTSLLLMADNGGGTWQSILALRARRSRGRTDRSALSP